MISQSNQILTAIIHGMRQSEPSNHVRLAATTALFNSLEFTRANFDKEVSDNYGVAGLFYLMLANHKGLKFISCIDVFNGTLSCLGL